MSEEKRCGNKSINQEYLLFQKCVWYFENTQMHHDDFLKFVALFHYSISDSCLPDIASHLQSHFFFSEPYINDNAAFLGPPGTHY